jgi:DNA-binding MarR family transcriptional regulator
MESDFTELTNNLREVDRLVHEPARLLILTILYAVESADFLYLQRQSNLTKGNLSAHLSRLEEAGYITIEKTYRGRIPLTLCQITNSGRQALENYHQHLKRFVNQANLNKTSKNGGNT